MGEKYDFWVILGSIRRIGKSDTAYWSIRRIWGLEIRLLEDFWSDTAYREIRYGVSVCGQTEPNLFPYYLTNRNELEVAPPIVGFVIEFSIT